MKKRIFSLFMVFALCFVSVDQAYADAGSIIVAGGSVAGVAAGAIAGPAVVAVFCAMMAFGMNVELTKSSEEAGMTKTQFLKNKLQEYCNEAQISANTFNNYILDQANILQNGSISISKKAGQLVQRFCNWLFDNNEVIDTEVGSISDYNAHFSLSGNFIQNGNGIKVNDSTSAYGLQFYTTNDGHYRCCVYRSVEEGPFDTTSYSLNGNYTSEYSSILYGDYYYVVRGITYITSNQSNTIANNSLLPYIGEFDSLQEFLTLFNAQSISTDTITGSESDYDVSKNVLNPADNETIVITPNINIPVPVDKDVTIDVNEYLDIIKDLIDGVADDVISAIDDVTGVPITIEFDPTQDWDPTIELEDNTDLPVEDDRTPVVPDELIPVDYDLEPLKFDLKGFFPFCIPWDIKDMLSKLNASPVAPSYTVNWYIPIVNETLTFTIDLSPYNDVADILRKMEVLAFCIGLALITRQMILRG